MMTKPHNFTTADVFTAFFWGAFMGAAITVIFVQIGMSQGGA